MGKKGIFKYSVDLRAVATMFFILAISLLPFMVSMPVWLLAFYWVAMVWFRSYAPYAQHNQGHLPVFRATPLNWLYDFLLAQLTGYTTTLWELHHVRGHHRHFLTPEKDVAGLQDPRTGQLVGRWTYVLRGNLTILRDSIRIGRAEAKAGQKSLLPKLWTELAVQALVTAALFYWNPWMALFFFVLPNILMAWAIWWESYQHHLEVPLTHAYDGSITITHEWFNFQTFNIGHHTAHHEKPTLHWSLLPARTAAILEKIHPFCVREKYKFFAQTSEQQNDESGVPNPIAFATLE